MNIKSINSISFSEKTDDGNHYKATNSGKISGVIGGSLLGGLGCYSEGKKHDLDALVRGSKIKNKALYVAFSCAVYSAIGLVCGSLIDLIVNGRRAKKADGKISEN